MNQEFHDKKDRILCQLDSIGKGDLNIIMKEAAEAYHQDRMKQLLTSVELRIGLLESNGGDAITNIREIRDVLKESLKKNPMTVNTFIEYIWREECQGEG